MPPFSIIIVETNPDMRAILRHAFEDRGYLTWTCRGPEVAQSLFLAVQPNVVLLDLDLEEYDPMVLLDHWTQLSPRTRVIVESRAGDDKRIREALNRGAHAFLVKPYSLPPLFELLETGIPAGPSALADLKLKAA